MIVRFKSGKFYKFNVVKSKNAFLTSKELTVAEFLSSKSERKRVGAAKNPIRVIKGGLVIKLKDIDGYEWTFFADEFDEL